MTRAGSFRRRPHSADAPTTPGPPEASRRRPCGSWGPPCLVDPGTGVYAPDPAWRDHFRGTAAHSTVTVDAAGQAVATGPFAWRDLPRARLRRWISNDRFDLADAEHDAYRRL